MEKLYCKKQKNIVKLNFSRILLQKFLLIGITCLLLPYTEIAYSQAQSSNDANKIELQLQQTLDQLASPKSAHANFNQQLLDQGLAELYRQKNYQLIWDNVTRYQSLLQALASIKVDGLNPDDYQLSYLANLKDTANLSQQQLISRDILATSSYLLALTHLSLGKTEMLQAQPMWLFKASRQDKRQIPMAIGIARMGLGNDINETFSINRPKIPLYHTLYQEMDALLQAKETKEQLLPIAAGPSIHPNAQDERIIAIRQRLAQLDLLNTHSESKNSVSLPQTHIQLDALSTLVNNEQPDNIHQTHYDAQLVNAIIQLQHRFGLEQDGIIGPATLAALNTTPQDLIRKLAINLERIRWLRLSLRPQILIVNVPGAKIFYFHDDELIWRAAVQVGTPGRPTPLLKSTITHFTLNPTWTIPPTILTKDKLPQIRRDPKYFEKHRYDVLDGYGNLVDPHSVDWSNPLGIIIRQPAGPSNALGKAVIRFPNPFSIYLHDTPHKEMFNHNKRVVSSGCVRVQDITELMALLGEDSQTFKKDEWQKKLQKQETLNIWLKKPIPLFIGYWTIGQDKDHRLQSYPDIYHLDKKEYQQLIAPVNFGRYASLLKK